MERARRTRTPKQKRPSDAGARAARLAMTMPCVHFPGDPTLGQVASWQSLSSPSARGVAPRDASESARVRHEHVFAFAGPSCYGGEVELGHVLLVFAPRFDGRGEACPFDTGSLIEPSPRLQPLAAQLESGVMTEADALAFVRAESVPLEAFRAAFTKWLGDSYDDPDRYCEATDDRYADGEPNRLPMPALLAENGRLGRAKRERCADRRAWTWELRFEGGLPFSELVAVVTSESHLQDALIAFDGIEVRLLPAGERPGGDAFYRYSGTMLLELGKDA